MTAEERQKWIHEHLLKVQFASLDDLATQLSASISTIRRDLNALESTGMVRRTHGGAGFVSAPRTDDYVFSQRETIQLAEKEAIGRLCATLIQPGQSVIVDAGTTAYEVARQLEGKTLHIITNSLPVAGFFASSANTEVIVSGGVIYPRLGVLVGPLAVEAFSRTHADVAIMSGGGITLEGITNSHALLIDIQRAMIQAASRVIFCFDHTKIGRRSVVHLCELESIDAVVTDAAAPREVLDSLRARGIEVFIAAESAPSLPLPKPVSARPRFARSVPQPLKTAPENVPPSVPSEGMNWD